MTNNDPLGNIPRYALYRGKKVRIVFYEENEFHIIDSHDQKRVVKRSDLIFLREKKKK